MCVCLFEDSPDFEEVEKEIGNVCLLLEGLSDFEEVEKQIGNVCLFVG